MSPSAISRGSFEQLQALFHEVSGIRLSPSKTAMVESRLHKRLYALGLPDFDAYCRFLAQPQHADERQRVIDLLTTNETYFFREPEQFTLLGRLLTTELRQRSLRVWSAACSTGEEPYSLAMLLLDLCPNTPWRIIGSDLSTRALERARRGIFPMTRLELLPAGYLKRFCLRGTNAYAGQLRVDPSVRARVEFVQHNLLDDAAPLGSMDVIFLRNVLIYFDAQRRRHIVQRVVERLAAGGVLFIGQAESLEGQTLPLRAIGRSAYRRS